MVWFVVWIVIMGCGYGLWLWVVISLMLSNVRCEM